jgi:phenylalanine racemase
VKNNKIEGVQPFNRFFFRSCYYHQLIAGLAAFGIPAESILLSYFVFPRKGFEIEKIVIPEKTLEKVLGYQNKRCNLSKKQLLHNIDKQRPVIVGVDCFHFESRPDTYQKMHDPHYVLVYGYDIDNGTLNVVDHNYRNSWEYSEKIISIGNLLYANKMLRNRPLKRKTTMQILKRCVNKEINDSIILEWYKCDLFQQAKIDSELNLETLKSMVSQSSTVLADKSRIVTNYLQEMKNFFSNLNAISVFKNTRDCLEKIFIIISAYSNLLSIFWRMESKNDYEFAYRHKENIQRKIDELICAEKIIYDYISEICKCQSKK